MLKKIKETLAELLLIVVVLVCIGSCLYTGILFCKGIGMDPNLITALATLLTAVVAVVFGCWGDQIKEFFSEKPKISFQNILKLRQSVPNTRIYEIYRLVLKNESKKTIKKAVIDLIEIESSYGHIRKIVPAPFQWTHLSASPRKIAPGQCVYLDFIEVSMDTFNRVSTRFVVPQLYGNPGMISLLWCSFVKIKVYGENIEPQEFKFKVDRVSVHGSIPEIHIEYMC